jgi:hypothetical protein
MGGPLDRHYRRGQKITDRVYDVEPHAMYAVLCVIAMVTTAPEEASTLSRPYAPAGTFQGKAQT